MTLSCVLFCGCHGASGSARRDAAVDGSDDIPRRPNAPVTRRLTQPPRTASLDQLGGIGIPFQENEGQWDPEVAYKADHFAGSLWVTTNGLIVHSIWGAETERAERLDFFSSSPVSGADPLRANDALLSNGETILLVSPPAAWTNGPMDTNARHPLRRTLGWTLTERFVHGHPQNPRGLEPAVTNVSYFLGTEPSRWAAHVATFGALSFGEVWPGIEVRLVATGNNVEKFFHVAPHRDPSLIELSIDGANSLRVSADRALILTTDHGEAAMSAPVAFQSVDGERRNVDVAYALTGPNSYGFTVGTYDPSYELVIDPILQSTFLGGSASETGRGGIALDGGGNVLVVSSSESNNYPGTTGGAQPARVANVDMVISRLNGSLTTLLQSTYLGGSNADYGAKIAVDPSGDVWVLGQSASANYPGTAGGAQATLGGGADLVLSRLSLSLTTLIQSTYLGGTADDYAHGDLALSSGNVLVVGHSQSPNFPGVAGGAQAAFGGGASDIVVARVNRALTTLVQSTYLGGSSFDLGTALAIDGGGAVVVYGWTVSNNFPGTTGGAQPTYRGVSDLVVSRLNGTLTSLLQSTYLGGSADDVGQGGIAIDGSGNVLVLGHTASTNFPGTAGSAQTTNAGGFSDLVVSRLNGSLTTLLRSTYLGGSNDDVGNGGVTITGSGEIVVFASSLSADYPAISGGALSTEGGGMVISRLSGNLSSLLQSTYLGGIGGDDGAYGDLTIDALGHVLIFGESNSANYPGTAGGAQAVFAGGDRDRVITRLTVDLLGCASNADCLTSPGGGATFPGRLNCNVVTRQCFQCNFNSDCEDGNVCTTNTCGAGLCSTTNLSAGSQCRAASGLCDQAELCPGGGAPCPADSVSALGVPCRASTGVCDLAETCNGVTSSCPPDQTYAPLGTVCRMSAGLCDLTETCSGVSNTCPPNAFATAAVSCRSANGDCDVAEFCTGVSAPCPSDVFAPARTPCAGGICDIANNCVECLLAADCDDGNPCTTNNCVSAFCLSVNVGAGVACGAGLSCDGNGSCSGCTLSTQCADGNDCTQDVCNLGSCSNPPVTLAAPCATGVCEVDGTPSCVECVSNAQCSGATPTCDLVSKVCVACTQSADCDDNNPCTADDCSLGACSHIPAAEGVACPDGLCTFDARCVECLSNTDCSGTLTLCDVAEGRCTDCTDPDVMCAPGSRCDTSTGLCSDLGCRDDTDCDPPTPTCETQTGRCLGCVDGSTVCLPNQLCDPETGQCGLDPNGDADLDGIRNGLECPALTECIDNDGDGAADYLDPDDDGDSIPTSRECPDPRSCVDTDVDSRPNYLDPDDDDDGIFTLDEVTDGAVYGADADLDGMSNHLDTDSDGDGSSDQLEGRSLSPNAIPAYLDVNFLGGGSLAGGALRCSVGVHRSITMALGPLIMIFLALLSLRKLPKKS